MAMMLVADWYKELVDRCERRGATKDEIVMLKDAADIFRKYKANVDEEHSYPKFIIRNGRFES